MSAYDIFIQALGLTASVIAITSLQNGDRRKILILQIFCCVLWMFHYGALGAFTAVVNNVIAMIRGVICYNNHKPWAKSKLWLALLIALFTLSAVFTWNGIESAFPCFAMILTTIGLWIHDMPKTRLLYLINSPFMLAYSILSGSYSTAVTEVFAFISFIVAIWRFDIRKKEPVS